MNDRRPPHDPERDTPPEDDLLEAVGAVARDDEATSPRRELLRRLVAGEATEEEIAALEREAETSEEARRDLEAFRPLGPELRERIVESLPQKTAEVTAEVTPFPTSDASTPAPPRPMRGAWIPLAAAALLAVAAGLWWLVGGVPGPSADFELASYSPELSGYVSDQRSGDVEPEDLPTFEMGGTFRLVLRPQRDVDADTDFDFYLADEDGVLEPWRVGYSRSADGAMRIEGTLGEDLTIEPGRWTFVFVWGKSDELPEPSRLQEVESAMTEAWRHLGVSFEVVEGETAFGELPLEVEYLGCFEVSEGPACVYDWPLTIWARSTPDAQIRVRIGERLVTPRPSRVDGGFRYRIDPTGENEIDPPGEGETVEVVASQGGMESRFALALAGYEAPDWLNEARQLLSRGDRAGARKLLEERVESSRGGFRGQALGLLARTVEGTEERIRLLEEATSLHRAEKRPIRLSQDLGMLLHYYVKSRDFARLRRELDRAEEAFDELPARAATRFAYNRGILENGVGNFRGALEALEAAIRLSRRVGYSRMQMLAETKLAQVLHQLGRNDDAVLSFRRTIDAPEFSQLDKCTRARIHNNLAWIEILGGGGEIDPLPHLDRALELMGDEACGRDSRLNLWLNRALALEARGSVWEARVALAEVEALQDAASTQHRLWWEDLEGRFALGQGRSSDALAHYRQMERLAKVAFEPEGRWRALVGQAQALDQSGRADEALQLYTKAETLLQEQSLRIPLGVDRAGFVSERDEATRRHLDLLLRENRVAEAFALARRSHSRVLDSVRRSHRLARLPPEDQATWDLGVARYLELRAEIVNDAKDDWRLSENDQERLHHRREDLRRQALRSLDRAYGVLPAEEPAELPAMRTEELVLAYHPLSTGWVGFAARPEAISYHRFELSDFDPRALSRELLEPFRESIENDSYRRVRILAYGPLRQVDVHALPWDDDVLLSTRPVVYAYDLTPSPSSGITKGRALVIGDPRGDLPAARYEAEVVAKSLRRRYSAVDESIGPNATRRRLLDAIPSANHLHYAGHGAYSVETPTSALGRSLLLANGEALTVGDVLALEQAPSEVVLSSCEGARDAGAAVPGLGLAHAFLVAGSRGVVAASRPVGDSDTARLFEHFYAARSTADLAQRLRGAQLAWRQEDATADWASFRLLVP